MKQTQTNFDFSQLHFLNPKAFWLTIVKSIWQIGKGMLPVFVIIGLKRDFNPEKWWVYIIPIALVLFSFVRAYIKYKFFSFQVENDELVLHQGWLSKEQTVVKFDKIHEVNLNQKFLHKILGLYNVAIDTAGSSKTEIEINGVSFQKALALKDVLTQRSTEETIETTVNDVLVDEIEESQYNVKESNNRIELGLSSLFKIGMTRNYLQTFGLLFAFGFQIADQLESIFYDKDESIYDDIYTKTSEFRVGLLWVGLLFGLILFVVVFNLVRTVFTYFNYQIQLKNKQLLVSFGLTDSHIISVPANKVQLFRFQQNYFQRLMNLFEVKILQVASDESSKKKKGLIVPGANYQELNQLFGVIYSRDLILHKNFIRPYIRSFIIKMMIWSAVFGLLVAGVVYQNQLEYLGYIGLIYSLIVFLTYIGYRNQKLFIEDDFIVVKGGIWDITTTYLHISKVQQLVLSQSIFQRKRQLGSLTLSTAGGRVSLGYYHFPSLQNLANEWIYQIEKNKYPWT